MTNQHPGILTMAKLYFRYGAMGSAKSLNLLAVAHNYQQQNKRVLLLKPHLDLRFGTDTIRSRAGLTMEADHLLYSDTVFAHPERPSTGSPHSIDISTLMPLHCILVDEAQFLSASIIDELQQLTIHCNIPVICYGLKTNFKGHLFEGAKRLLELADTIEEIKTTCFFCNRKATQNGKFLDGVPVTEGPEIEMGAEEKYLPVCKYCFLQRHL